MSRERLLRDDSSDSGLLGGRSSDSLDQLTDDHEISPLQDRDGWSREGNSSSSAVAQSAGRDSKRTRWLLPSLAALAILAVIVIAAFSLVNPPPPERKDWLTAVPSGPLHTITALEDPSYNQQLGRFIFSLNTTTHVLSRKDIGIARARRTWETHPLGDFWLQYEYMRWASSDPRALEWESYDADDGNHNIGRERVRFLTTPVVATTGPRMRMMATQPGAWRHRLFALEYGTGAVLQGVYTRLPGPLADEPSQRELHEAWLRPWAHEAPGSYGWRSLGGSFAWRPTVSVWTSPAPKNGTGSTECTDVYAVTAGRVLMKQSFWQPGGGGPMIRTDNWIEVGKGFVGEVGLAVNFRKKGKGPGQVHAAAIKDGEYQHAVSSHGPAPWTGAWTALGVPYACRDLGVDQLGYPVMVVWGLIQVQVVVVCGGAVWHRTRDSDGLWSAGWRPFGGDLPLDDEGDVIRVETHSLVSTSALAEGALSRALYVRAEGGDETYKISCMDPEVHVVEEHSIMTDGSVRVNEGGKPTPGSTFDPLFPWGVWVYYGTTGQGSFRQPEFYDVF